MQWYLTVLRKYAVFSGRARRREFWMFTLIHVLISIGISIIDAILGTEYGAGYGVLGTIYALALLIPSLAVGVRRLHDTGRTRLVDPHCAGALRRVHRPHRLLRNQR
jgi:uncharacterized membrane protein YhaH (DUF805 family)